MSSDFGLLVEREPLSVFERYGKKLTVEYTKEVVYSIYSVPRIGEHWRVYLEDYPDGFHASIIGRPGSYGYDMGFYELAFIKDGSIYPAFEKNWGDTVLGHIDEEQAIHWMDILMDKMGLI